jgi:membrane protein DedA with SNARE-associated domain
VSFLSTDGLPHLIATYGYAIVALTVALEGMGIPVPGETMLVATAIYAGTTHELAPLSVIAAAVAGAILGDNTGFWIGREVGYRLLLRHGARIGLTERRIKLGQYLFLRHGAPIVFFGRFVAVLRCFATLLAGANRMAWPRFVLFNALGGTIWASIFGGGAYAFGHVMQRLARPAGIATGAAAAIIVVAGFLLMRRHAAELEERADRALPGPLRPPHSGRL